MAREGAQIVVHGRNPERAQRVADEIRRDGGKAWVALGDLGRPDNARAVAKSALEALGGVDILVNNAGGADEGMKAWLETDLEQWHATFEQNIYSSVRLLRELVPEMKRSGWGRIIQVASGVATQPFPIGPDYAAAKAAMVNATVSLAKALAGTGITVNTVSPGPIVTPAAELSHAAATATCQTLAAVVRPLTDLEWMDLPRCESVCANNRRAGAPELHKRPRLGTLIHRLLPSTWRRDRGLRFRSDPFRHILIRRSPWRNQTQRLHSAGAAPASGARPH